MMKHNKKTLKSEIWAFAVLQVFFALKTIFIRPYQPSSNWSYKCQI